MHTRYAGRWGHSGAVAPEAPAAHSAQHLYHKNSKIGQNSQKSFFHTPHDNDNDRKKRVGHTCLTRFLYQSAAGRCCCTAPAAGGGGDCQQATGARRHLRDLVAKDNRLRGNRAQGHLLARGRAAAPARHHREKRAGLLDARRPASRGFLHRRHLLPAHGA